ncbi:PspC domain-containing protein [Bifidobacterium sp. SMB2]|uniref:PspC domain-containing protein n=1 Tax=Bifidobacterium saimiriisciurei TaxID=2661627 RepID=A0ABX0CBT9_9BIFI|nr:MULTISPECIES: PspC domain-containing protein [Bifidobacterium]NEG97088.1 PspC domain-containing protein [Bifidobacterium sp. SMB2]NEH12136.1 PspC domain-containing protein [Bifidobacterium saimiriisciurei]
MTSPQQNNQSPFGGQTPPPYQSPQPQPRQPGVGQSGPQPSGPGPAMPNKMPNQPLGSRFFNWIRTLGLNRSTNRWLGGVSGAIANRLGWDPIIIRIIWFAFFCAAGFGALLYGVMWLLLPDERDGAILAEEAVVHASFPSSFWIAIVMIIIGCPGSVFVVPFVSIPVFVVLIIVAAVMANRNANARGDAPVTGNGGFGGTGPVMPPSGPQPAAGATMPNAGTMPQQPGPAAAGTTPRFQTVPPTAPVAAPMPPVVYRRKPAGPVVVGITSGLLILSLAALLWFLFFGGFADMPSPVMMICLWILGATFVLGIITIIVGFTGRKSGGLIPITILALICSLGAYAAMPTYTAVANHISGQYGESAIRTTVNYTSSDFYQLRSHGLQAVSSDVTVDLSDWRTVYPDSSDCPTGDFPIDAMSSTVHVIVPNGCWARSNMNLMFGTASTYDVSGASDVSNNLVLVGDAAFSSVSVTNSKSDSSGSYTDPYGY